MASRAKKKREIKETLPEQFKDKVTVATIDERRSLNNRLNFVLIIALLIILILIFAVPVINLSMTIDFAPHVSEEDDIDLSVIPAQTYDYEKTAFEVMIMPSQIKDGDLTSQLVKEAQFTKSEKINEKLVEIVKTVLLTPKEMTRLKSTATVVVILNYLIALTLIATIVIALIERNKKEVSFMGVLVASTTMTILLIVEFIYELIMYVDSKTNIDVGIGWGLLVQILIATLLSAYTFYHYKKMKKFTEGKNEKVS